MVGISGLNPAKGMDVLLLCLLYSQRSCDEIITRPEESYGVLCVRFYVCAFVCVCLILCDLETSTVRRPRLE